MLTITPYSHTVSTEETEKNLLVEMHAEEENRDINVKRRTSVSEGGLLFKAKPIETEDKYPCPAPKHIPLTEPKSPLLLTSARLGAMNTNALKAHETLEI